MTSPQELPPMIHYRDVNGRPTVWNASGLADRNPFPSLVLLPAAVVVDGWLERARIGLSVARTRVLGAWVVLRGGEPLSDERNER